MKEIEKRVIYENFSIRFFCYIVSEILYSICVLSVYYLLLYKFLEVPLIFKSDKIFISFFIFGIIFGIISSSLYRGKKEVKEVMLGLHIGGPILVGLLILTPLIIAIKTFIDCI